MVKLLYGIYTSEDGGTVRFKTPNLSPKEADNLLENVLFSTNIFGHNNKSDVAFTIPVMYLPSPYSHGRIYFKFISEEDYPKFSHKALNPEITPETFPLTVSLFVTFENLTDLTNTEPLDKRIWELMKVEFTEEIFKFLKREIEELVTLEQ